MSKGPVEVANSTTFSTNSRMLLGSRCRQVGTASHRHDTMSGIFQVLWLGWRCSHVGTAGGGESLRCRREMAIEGGKGAHIYTWVRMGLHYRAFRISFK